MKHLQTYKIFESVRSLTPKQKEFLDRAVERPSKWTFDPSTGLVDIEGSLSCEGANLDGGLPVYFGKVTGDFVVNDSDLPDLGGCPSFVGGDFSCRGNWIDTLEGGPEVVKGDFDCNWNSLISFDGVPLELGGAFWGPYEIYISPGENFLEALTRIYLTGTTNQSKVAEPTVQKNLGDPVVMKVFQEQVDKNPVKMIMKLKDVLKDPRYGILKWPKHLEQEKDLLSDLSDIGL